MRYVRQLSLLPSEEFFAESDDNTRLTLVLRALPDEKLRAWLRECRASRRDDYPYEVLWCCLIAKYVYQIITYAELIRELWRNESLRRLVGLDSPGAMPQDYHFSRLLKRLASDEGLALLDEMFQQLVSDLGAQLPNFGRHLAVDATAVHAYSNEMRRDKSDLDAAWSARPKRQRRRGSAGKVEEYTDFWFGYLVHLVVDCETELPIGYEVTAANVNETTRFRELLDELRQAHPDIAARVAAVLADAGYDSKANCEYVLKVLKALPVIKMRLTQPKSKRDEIFGAAICPCNELGTPICASGHKMVYWGRDGDYLKWRCPAKCGKAQCTQMGRCTSSGYGNVLKVRLWEDPRRFPGLARESRKWKRLYRKRTAVERVNSRLKEHLLLNNLTVRGIRKVRAHTGLSLLVLLAGSKAMMDVGAVGRIRQTVRLAA